MIATLEMIRSDFGGVEGYLRDECNFTQEDLKCIQENLVIAAPPLHNAICRALTSFI